LASSAWPFQHRAASSRGSRGNSRAKEREGSRNRVTTRASWELESTERRTERGGGFRDRQQYGRGGAGADGGRGRRERRDDGGGGGGGGWGGGGGGSGWGRSERAPRDRWASGGERDGGARGRERDGGARGRPAGSAGQEQRERPPAGREEFDFDWSEGKEDNGEGRWQGKAGGGREWGRGWEAERRGRDRAGGSGYAGRGERGGGERGGGERGGGERGGGERGSWAAQQQYAGERGSWAARQQYAGERGGRGWGRSSGEVQEEQTPRPPSLRERWVGDYVYGVSPVLAALRAGRREVHALYIQEGMQLSKRKDKAAVQVGAGAGICREGVHERESVGSEGRLGPAGRVRNGGTGWGEDLKGAP
jgi:hypothetical protein